MNYRRVVVLGSLGLIGSEVVKNLHSLGISVVAVARRAPQGILAQLGNVTWVCGSVDDTKFLDRIIQKRDDIFHFAETGFPGHPQEWEEGFKSLERLQRLCTLAKEHDCRLIYPSSGGTVYGRALKTPISEDHPLCPISPYGMFKKMAEDILLYFKRVNNLRLWILRISNCYGPSFCFEKKQGIIGVTASSILAGRQISLVAEGKQVRDFIHAKDVAELCGLIHLSEEEGEIINVGTGIGLSMLDVVRSVASELQISPSLQLLPARTFDVEENVLDPTRANRLLGWAAKKTFGEGVREICQDLLRCNMASEE